MDLTRPNSADSLDKKPLAVTLGPVLKCFYLVSVFFGINVTTG